MDRFDFTPLYRNTIGFDRLSTLLDNESAGSYPPYNIEAVDDLRYRITLAVAGFEENELDVEVKSGVLTIVGKKAESEDKQKFLHHGIANRSFQRRFQLADYVEVVGAKLDNGLLTLDLVKEIPEAMKSRRIPIGHQNESVIETEAA